MKKTLSILASVAILATLFTGCTKTPATDTATKSPTTKGSVLVGDPSEEYYMISFLSGIDYWKTCFKGYQDAGNTFGIKTVYAGDPTADVAKQVTVFEQVVAKNPKGIAITCINADALKEPIEKARAAGIEVVTFDSDSPKSGRSSYLSTGNEQAGAEAAAYFAKLMPNGGQVALLYTVGAENSEARVKGFEGYCEKFAPNLKVAAKVNDKGDQTEATKNMSAALQTNSSINGVFCMDGAAGVAGPTAVSESGLKNIKVISFDTDSAVLDMIKSGMIEATVAQGTYNMGYWSMNFLYQLSHKLPAKSLPGFIDTGTTIVTKDNVADFYVKK